ncbi:sugar phosphate nucleotidyltransferase [Pontibacter fetidus]|uniref:glucose-1-phosphate thymidylyltransferase n=1 Tax=Pontibacter fetidus TaxID=2700082 RepID=A0A6B2H0M4_9BACT|nr:sugar phosphate nucleotidyltransferase [Pontibacter fetidus]NDK55871.1 dTDP-glucose pyrophosphorylase [Pontibacter fetidus]
MKQTIVGIIPAAGLGSRLGQMPFSKELYPLGCKTDGTPKVVSEYLLELMREAGAEQVYFIVRNGKWDIPGYFSDGSNYSMAFAYLLMNRPYGTPFSVDQSYSFVKDKTIAFGFPDIIVEPKSVFVKLLNKRQETDAAIVLGLFKVEHPHKWDMVETDEDGNVKAILPKPEKSELTQAWCIAVWSPAFTEFMHQYLKAAEPRFKLGELKEIPMGTVVQAAIVAGLKVQSDYFSEGSCLDMGTPEDLKVAIAKYSK